MEQLYLKKLTTWVCLTMLFVIPFFGTAQTHLYQDAVSSGTIWHSNGAEITNPLNNSDNSSATAIANNGAGAWEETQIFPDTYTITSGDKLYISFYNPNGANGWRLKMSLSTTGENAYIGDYNHEAGASTTWVESSIDLSSYAGEDLTKITIYPAGGEAKSVNYDNIYIKNSSGSQSSGNGTTITNLFDDAVASGTIWHSNGAEVSNPHSDRKNPSSTVLQNNGAGSWEETQLFPDTYTVQTGDKLFISFCNPNGASSWQLKMSLSTGGADKYIGDYNHESPASDGWYESVIDLSNYSGQDITKITIYPAGGEAKSIYYDQLYLGSASISGATNLFRDNAVLGLWNSDGGLVNNPQKDAINYSGQVVVNNGSGGWKDTQWFPNYKIQSGDKFYISFYNPNNAAAFQLRMDLSSTGSFTWIGEPNHDANAANGWAEVALDLNAYAGEIITKVQLYSSAGEAKQIYFDNIYFSSSSQQSNYWAGTSSSDWATAANWEGSFVPSSLSNVTITSASNKPDISSDITINNLMLQDNLTVTSGTLTVNGDIDGTSGAITVASGASLLTKGQISGTSHQIKRTTTFDQQTGKYSVVGSPVSSASTADLGSLVYAYDETIAYGADGNSRFVKVTTPEAMSAGDAYFSAFTGEVTFTGTPNTGNIDVALVYNESNDGGASTAGFNLVANPYPCAIDYSKLVANNSGINSAIYLWDDDGSDLGQRSNGDYITVNNLGTASGGSSRAGDWNGYIGSGQGFFVKATAAGNLSFTDAIKVNGNNADQGYFRTTGENKQTLTIRIAGNDRKFESLIGFVDDATEGLDRLYDAPLFGSSSLAIASLIDQQPYAIQGLPALSNEISIPLAIRIEAAGAYTISLSDQSLSDWNIYLHDHLLHKIVAVNNIQNYRFQSNGEQSNSRFTLTITKNILSTPSSELSKYNLRWDVDGLQIIRNNQSLQQGALQITDISGRNLLNQELFWQKNELKVNFDFERNRIYLIRITTSESSYTHKMIIR